MVMTDKEECTKSCNFKPGAAFQVHSSWEAATFVGMVLSAAGPERPPVSTLTPALRLCTRSCLVCLFTPLPGPARNPTSSRGGWKEGKGERARIACWGYKEAPWDVQVLKALCALWEPKKATEPGCLSRAPCCHRHRHRLLAPWPW